MTAEQAAHYRALGWWYDGRIWHPPQPRPVQPTQRGGLFILGATAVSQLAKLALLVIFAIVIVAVAIAVLTTHGAAKSDIAKITPINPDCATNAQLCKADADQIRSACNGGDDEIGAMLNNAPDDATRTLMEQELTALCPHLEPK